MNIVSWLRNLWNAQANAKLVELQFESLTDLTKAYNTAQEELNKFKVAQQLAKTSTMQSLFKV